MGLFKKVAKKGPDSHGSTSDSATPRPNEAGPTQGAGALDHVQTLLDLVGLIPGVGEVADGANALIHLARGNYADAALSAAAMIPIAGTAATGGKFLRKGLNLADAAMDTKSTRRALDALPAKEPGGVGKRSKNKLRPDPNAAGDHTTFRRRDDGVIDKYQEFHLNPKNPNKWDAGRRFDGQQGGSPHHNKVTGKQHSTPHINDRSTPGGVRDPEPHELPKGF